MTSSICVHDFVEKRILETINVVEKDNANTTTAFCVVFSFIYKANAI